MKKLLTYLLFLPFVASALGAIAPAGGNTDMKITELQLDTFTRPGITHHTQKGDYTAASGLTFYDGRPALAPAWSAAQPVQTGSSTILARVLASFAGGPSVNQPIFWIGNTGAYLTLTRDYILGAPYNQTALVASNYTLGGYTGQNHIFTELTQLYVITSNKNIYRGSYTSNLTLAYTGTNARSLANWNNYVYMLTDSAILYRRNPDTGNFDSIYTPPMTTSPLFMTPFRGYLLIGGLRADSSLLLTQYTDSDQARIIQQLPVRTYGAITNGHTFAIHQGDIYITTRAYAANPDSTNAVTVYCFDGNTIYPLREVTIPAGTPTGIGLLSWQDRLILYVLYEGTNPTQYFYALEDDRFALLSSITDTGAVTYATADVIGNQLTRLLYFES